MLRAGLNTGFLRAFPAQVGGAVWGALLPYLSAFTPNARAIGAKSENRVSIHAAAAVTP